MALPLALAIAIVAARVAAPNYARTRLIAAAQRECPRCVLDIGSLGASPMFRHIYATNIHYRTDPQAPVRVEMWIDRLDFDFVLMSLIHSPAHIHSVKVRGVLIAVTEDVTPEALHSTHRPFHPAPSPFLSLPPLRIDHIAGDSMQLLFTDRIAQPPDSPPAPPTIASMLFGPFDTHLSPVGTRAGIAPATLTMNFFGHIAGTGALQMTARLDPLDEATPIAIDFHGTNQNLHPFETYAVPAEGIHMRGLVDVASGSLRYADQSGSIRFGATFRHLVLSLTPTARRGVIVTALGNLQIATTIAQANDETALCDRSVTVRLARREGDPLPGFLWSLLRAALMRLATVGRHEGDLARTVDTPR
jgi:hypothetical protein